VSAAGIVPLLIIAVVLAVIVGSIVRRNRGRDRDRRPGGPDQ
jgi:hypothetical protein